MHPQRTRHIQNQKGSENLPHQGQVQTQEGQQQQAQVYFGKFADQGFNQGYLDILIVIDRMLRVLVQHRKMESDRQLLPIKAQMRVNTGQTHHQPCGQHPRHQAVFVLPEQCEHDLLSIEKVLQASVLLFFWQAVLCRTKDDSNRYIPQ